MANTVLGQPEPAEADYYEPCAITMRDCVVAATIDVVNALKRFIDESDREWGDQFDLFIQTLIVISLITFSIETLPNLSETAHYWLRITEIIIVVIFTIEYIVRILIAEKPTKFIFSFFGIVDLLCILPFYLTTGIDLRVFRSMRLFRLLRVFKFVRYSEALQRFHRALSIAKEEIVLYLAGTLLLLYFSAVGIYYFENAAQPEIFSSVFHSLWWAVATLTTVGYGDVYPVTVGGRVFTFCVLLIGLGIVSVPAGLVASALNKAREMDDLTPDELDDDLDEVVNLEDEVSGLNDITDLDDVLDLDDG